MQTILLIDDHQLFSDGLELILSRSDKGIHIEQLDSARAALADAGKLNDFDLILVDLEMPNINGFDFLRALRERAILTPVAIVSASQNRSDIETVLKLGAVGFIPKYAPSDEMLKGVKELLAGNHFVPEQLVGPIDWPKLEKEQKHLDETEQQLSERQKEILQMMYSGKANKDIATILGISESAVKTHITRLFKFFEVKNRTACVKQAIEQGLIEL